MLLLKGIGSLGSAPGAYPLLTHKNFDPSGPNTILNSLANSLAAEFVNATKRTFLAYPSQIILTARKLPVVVFPHPAGPITPATPPDLTRQFNTLD
jgi:hypothetical protein